MMVVAVAAAAATTNTTGEIVADAMMRMTRKIASDTTTTMTTVTEIVAEMIVTEIVAIVMMKKIAPSDDTTTTEIVTETTEHAVKMKMVKKIESGTKSIDARKKRSQRTIDDVDTTMVERKRRDACHFCATSRSSSVKRFGANNIASDPLEVPRLREAWCYLNCIFVVIDFCLRQSFQFLC